VSKRIKDLPFLGHLEELRGRIIYSVISVLIASCFFYVFIDKALEIVISPVGRLVFISPSEAFWAHMSVTLLGGVFLALPFLFYQIWAFISVGLTEKERRIAFLFAPFSFILFLSGAAFTYFVALPLFLKFLLSFSSDQIIPMITVQRYISFAGSLCFGFGAVFEMPLVIVFLTKIGVATPDFFISKRKHAVVVIFILAAFLTPPDCASQLLMAVPLLLLFEVSVFLSKLTYKSKGKNL